MNYFETVYLEVISHLHELPLVHAEAGGAPVQDLGEGQLPPVGEDDGQTASLQRLQEPETAKTPASRHKAERGVGQEVVIIPSRGEKNFEICKFYLLFSHLSYSALSSSHLSSASSRQFLPCLQVVTLNM